MAFLRRWPCVVCTSACKSSAIFSRSTRANNQVADRAGAHIGLEHARRQLAQAAILGLGQDAAHLEAIDLLKLVLLLAHQRIKLALQALLKPLALLDNLVLLALALGIGQQLGRRHIALAVLLHRLQLLVEQLIQLVDHLLGDQLAFFDQNHAVERDIFRRRLAGLFLQVGAQRLALGGQRLALGLVILLDPPLGRDLGRLHAAQILRQRGCDLDPLALGLALDALALDIEVGLHLLAQRRPAVLVHRGDDVGCKVQHALHVARRNIQQQSQAAGRALHEPDMADRRCQRNVAHTVAPNLRARDFDAAFIANYALIADALVFSTIALPILLWAQIFVHKTIRRARA